tara:strand:+ start:19583 stop:19981 length:399 start_codon:yes stop_codon:yes gene_type:complete
MYQTGCLYNADGRILAVYEGINEDALAEQQLDDAVGHLLGTCCLDDYVDINTLEIKPRTELLADFDTLSIAADGVTEAVLSGLPIPCTVYVDFTPYLVNDGDFEFSVTNVGPYKIVVDEAAYLRKEWVINGH